MSIRSFIFCDICNPQGLRPIEFRRSPRGKDRGGRRISDGRAWYEGNIIEAVESIGWVIGSKGEHICPDCRELHSDK